MNRFDNKTILRVLSALWFLMIIGGCANKGFESTQQPAEQESETQVLEQEQNPEASTIQQPSLTASPFQLSPLTGQQLTVFKQGSRALQEQDFLKAQSLFEQVLAVEATHSASAFNLGLAYIGQEKDQQAIELLKKAISFDSNNVYAMNQLAILHRKNGSFEDAKALWVQALTQWPDYPQAHYNIAILYDLYLGQFELALKHYQQYQSYLDEPDRLVKAWIADVSRRLNSQ